MQNWISVDLESSDVEKEDVNINNLSTNQDVDATFVLPDHEISRLKVGAGISLVIFAGFSFTASNIIQKFYVPTLTFWQLLLHRAIVQVLQKTYSCLIRIQNKLDMSSS
jgi:hypothetical protein